MSEVKFIKCNGCGDLMEVETDTGLKVEARKYLVFGENHICLPCCKTLTFYEFTLRCRERRNQTRDALADAKALRKANR